MKIRALLAFALSTVFTTGALGTARAETLTTSYETGASGDEGIMFDLVATQAIRITGIQFAFEDNPLTDGVEVFTKTGTHVGSETTPADWTLAGAASITVSALEVPSPVFALSTPIDIPAGGQVALYIQRDNGSGPNISSESAGGPGFTIAASDTNLVIFNGTLIDGDFTATNGTNWTPNITIHYTLVDAAPPAISIIGKKKIKTSEPRQSIFGIATDDVGIASVSARFKKARGNGSTRTITRTLSADPNGLFRIVVKTFAGRNPVRFTATDTDGNLSPTATVVVIGE